MVKSKWDEEDDRLHARGLRTPADIMLDCLDSRGTGAGERMRAGASGGSRERSAWMVLACVSDEPMSVELACRSALKKGASLEDIAFWATECDSNLALDWCLGEAARRGVSGPGMLMEVYGSAIELAQRAIASGASRCVGLLERSFGPLDCPTPEGHGRVDALTFAAFHLKLGPLEALMEERGTGPVQAQQALGILSERFDMHWSSGHSNPADVAVALMARGAVLGSHAGSMDVVPHHGHDIADCLLGGLTEQRSRRSGESTRTLWDLWQRIRKTPGWTSWDCKERGPLGLHCLSLPRLDPQILTDVFADNPELVSSPLSTEALSRGACQRVGVKNETAGFLLSKAMALGCPKGRPEQIAEVLAGAMPSKPESVAYHHGPLWAALFRDLALGCPAELEAFASEASRLYDAAGQVGRPKTQEDWAPWEALNLAVALWPSRSAPGKPSLRL